MNFGKWIGFVALVISLYIMWEIRQIILLVFTAVILANSLNILVKLFQKWSNKLGLILGGRNLRIKRGYAVLLSISLSGAIFYGFFWLIVPPLATQFEQLAVKVLQGIEQLNIWLNTGIEQIQNRFAVDLSESLRDFNNLTEQLGPLLNQVLDRGWTVFSSSLGVVLNSLLLLVLTIMILADPKPYREGFVRLFPSFYRQRINRIINLCGVALQGWLIGILFNMLAIAILSFIGLLVLKIPLALAQAMLAGIFTFIPNIGPALSVVPPIAIALGEAPWKALAVLILYILIQQIESNILTPLVMAQQVSLLPAFTLLAQVFFATFFGFLGLFLALPLTVIGQVLIKEVLIVDILNQWQKQEKKAKKGTPVVTNVADVQALLKNAHPNHREAEISVSNDEEELNNG